eukprot:scaffold2098_cov235-Pinguiococcus_pyrenoidosus.AAC.3
MLWSNRHLTAERPRRTGPNDRDSLLTLIRGSVTLARSTTSTSGPVLSFTARATWFSPSGVSLFA